MEGKLIKGSELKIEVNLSNVVYGVESNIGFTVVDCNGIEHLRTLFVRPE